MSREVRMKSLDGGCIFLMAFAVFIGFFSLRLGVGSIQVMGPGFMPILVSVALFLLCLIALILEIRKEATNSKEKATFHWETLRKPAMLIVALIAYTFLLKPLGYLIMTFVIMCFMFFMTEAQRWRRDALLAAVITIVSFVLFNKWLRLQLPAGLLGLGQ